jgi:hypothetical protein
MSKLFKNPLLLQGMWLIGRHRKQTGYSFLHKKQGLTQAPKPALFPTVLFFTFAAP